MSCAAVFQPLALEPDASDDYTCAPQSTLVTSQFGDNATLSRLSALNPIFASIVKMTGLYTSLTDKLARQLLKAARQGRVDEALTLALIERWLPNASLDAVSEAVAFAVREGWLEEQSGA